MCETDLQQRKQPVYTQQDIAALNNAYNVMVGEVNKAREHEGAALSKSSTSISFGFSSGLEKMLSLPYP